MVHKEDEETKIDWVSLGKRVVLFYDIILVNNFEESLESDGVLL